MAASSCIVNINRLRILVHKIFAISETGDYSHADVKPFWTAYRWTGGRPSAGEDFDLTHAAWDWRCAWNGAFPQPGPIRNGSRLLESVARLGARFRD